MGWLVSGRGTNLFYSQETFGYVTDLFKQGLQHRSIRNNQTVVDLIRKGGDINYLNYGEREKHQLL